MLCYQNKIAESSRLTERSIKKKKVIACSMLHVVIQCVHYKFVSGSKQTADAAKQGLY